MSLIRLQLRTATVTALIGNPDAPATMAGPLVFDSKMDPLNLDEGEVTVPAIIVYSDETTLVQSNTGKGGASFSAAETKLVIDLAVTTFTKGASKIITTDPELEAVLDIFEWQVWQALTNPYAATTAPWSALVKAVTEYSSVPGRAAEQSNRVAMRQITMTVRTAIDCGVRATIGTPPPAPNAPLLGGVHYLQALEERLSTEPDFSLVAAQLRAARTGTPTVGLAALRRIAAGFYTARPATDPTTGQPTLDAAPGSRVNVNWQP